MNPNHREMVKATAAVLREHGVTLTSHFYARMFAHNPELKQIFNQGHQRAGQQQQALAMAVTAYAEQIDDPSVLLPVLTMVANKHVSLGIRAEHYAIVGKHLLASIAEVLGAAANDALLAAWAEAYQELAATLIGLEQNCYQQMVNQDGGWSGWRAFRVVKKEVESEEITSFYLQAADGGKLPGYLPGQYISLRVLVPQLGYMQPRQYSLSCAPGQEYFRISVKREQGQVAGMVSNLLHDTVQVGNVIDLAPPAGDFFLHQARSTPVVLISAGVGITPMVAMLEHLLAKDAKGAKGGERQVAFVHACRHGRVHAFGQRIAALRAQHAQLTSFTYYETPEQTDRLGTDYDRAGRINLRQLESASLQQMLLPGADYYLCGPLGFLQEQKAALLAQGVAAQTIHLEVFGTGGFAQ